MTGSSLSCCGMFQSHRSSVRHRYPCPRRISKIGWKRRTKKEEKRKNEDIYIIKEQIHEKFNFLVCLNSDTLHSGLFSHQILMALNAVGLYYNRFLTVP